MVYAVNNRLKSSVQKVNLVVNLIRGEQVSLAMMLLQFTKKRVANDVKKVLFAAITNAQNDYSMDIDKLRISKVFVGKAKGLKRFRPRARGRGDRINKHYSNIKIFLSVVA